MPSDPRVITTTTADGVQLAIGHVPAQVHAGGTSRGAVILQHGLGANAVTLNYRGRSLAQYLAQQGFDAYVSELRGAGRSQKPRHAYGIDDYLDYDVPAIIDAVRTDSGRDQVSWVGHSMGGILMMMYGIEHPDAPIDRFVAVGSALDYRPGKSVHRQTLAARPLAGSWLSTLPFGALSRLNAQVAGVGPVFPAEQMNFWRSNIERDVMRRVMAHGFTPIPMRLLDDLATTFHDQGLSRKRGELLYLPRAHEFRLPTLLIGGSRDVQAPDEAIAETASLIRNASLLEVKRFGTPHGHADHYGHVDLIVGTRAPQEVWPEISKHLGG